MKKRHRRSGAPRGARIGYKLSSEECGPRELVRLARQAEEAGFHPALVAQAAATCALLMEGRFFLGLGTGENLNEHLVGQGWPATEVRQERFLGSARHDPGFTG